MRLASDMTESELRAYLQTIHVSRLQSAARMGGLRWKNGEPGTDKAGIINRLIERGGSPLNATVATLQRMERGEQQPAKQTVSFTDDDFRDDDSTDQAVTRQEPEKHPLTQSIAQAIDLSGYVKRDEWNEANRTARANLAEAVKLTREGFESIHADIDALKQRAPIQFVFPDKRAATTVDPTDHHESFPKLVQYLEINRRVLLTGEAGTGKSVAAKNAAKILGADFYYQPPVSMAHELIGHRDAQGVFHETPLTRAFKKGGLLLCDEMDASMADALLVANSVFDGNGWATLGDGELHQMSPGFMVIANTNTDCNGATMQYPGRMRLDGATIARFGVRIHWKIDPRIETMMAQGQTGFYRAVVAVRDFMVAREIVDVNATPRHLKTGALLLNANAAPRDEIFRDVLCNGALAAVWTEVLRLPAVNAFLRG